MEREELRAAYSEFINTEYCRQSQEELRSLIHTAFVAGWCAGRRFNPPDKKAEPPR